MVQNGVTDRQTDRQTDTAFYSKDQDHNIVIAMSSSSCADTDSELAGGIKMFRVTHNQLQLTLCFGSVCTAVIKLAKLHTYDKIHKL